MGWAGRWRRGWLYLTFIQWVTHKNPFLISMESPMPISAAVVVLVLLTQRNNSNHKIPLPPGPKKLPFLSSLL